MHLDSVNHPAGKLLFSTARAVPADRFASYADYCELRIGGCISEEKRIFPKRNSEDAIECLKLQVLHTTCILFFEFNHVSFYTPFIFFVNTKYNARRIFFHICIRCMHKRRGRFKYVNILSKSLQLFIHANNFRDANV